MSKEKSLNKRQELGHMPSNKWIIPDYVNETSVKRFAEIVSKNVVGLMEPKIPFTGSHLLFFHPISNNLSRDGYYDYQTPANILEKSIEFRRRMWVQGRIQFIEPLTYTWYDCVEDVKFVRNLNGDYFVGLDRTLKDKNGECFVKEFRMLIYTDKGVSDDSFKIAENFKNTHSITFEDIDVMKYSGISSNPHRIHWDRDYTRTVEGYKDIIVQGPFIVQTTLNYIETKYSVSVVSIKYKNACHIYADATVEICENGIDNGGRIQVVVRDPKCRKKVFFEALLVVKSRM